MRVLTDLHNGGLYTSLHLLLEKRFGWELMRPIGEDWFTSGYWKIAEPYGNWPETITQYLGINDRPYDPYVNLNGDIKETDGIYHIYSPEGNFEHKAITFEMFKEMDFDLIIATHPSHECWQDLREWHPKAKFVIQLGNENQTTTAQNVLSSVWAYQPLPNQNICYYHQEFDLTEFCQTDTYQDKLIRSFVHLHPDKELFDIYHSSLPEFTFESWGMGTDHGPSQNIAQQIKESMFGWHIKMADGYGHVIHNWSACGKPIITKGSYYLGKTGGLLLEDGVTCIDLDKHTFQENLDLIRQASDPETYKQMSDSTYKRFTDVVNFESEAESIKRFLSNLI